jgi:hypothetical protein
MCERNAEKDTIKHILQQNKYQFSGSIKQKLNRESHKNKSPPKEQKNKQARNKWTTFTYFGHAVRKVTNIFKNTNLKVAYRTTNNIRNTYNKSNKKTMHTNIVEYIDSNVKIAP